jgi:hypothetical protein
MRTLLPVFDKYKEGSLITKEAPETFEWMKEEHRRDFEMARDALDKLSGSREYLKSYVFDEDNDGLPFGRGMGIELLGLFGNHHSGSSATRLAFSYKHALINWDKFVLENKMVYKREEYDSQQLTKDDIAELCFHDNNKEALKNRVNDIITKFDIKYDYWQAYEMLMDLVREKEYDEEEARINREKKRFEDCIGILKHHYKFPFRWFDNETGSSLFGSLDNITPKMMNAMELIYPDYREHIRLLKAKKDD